MKTIPRTYVIISILFMTVLCTKPATDTPEDGKKPGFEEAVPDTVHFTNAEFTYNGDDIGEAFSDGWVVKLYTDMEIDESGAPVGPGSVIQLLLNAKYNEEQEADAGYLKGTYSEMINSGNFAAGTFVSGYMASIDLPGGEVLELADATFYADLSDGSTKMDYDLIDEGAVRITGEDGRTYTIEGVLVGKKYTKRYFTWKGTVEPKSTVQEGIPNSTLKTDITGLSFTRGQLQDKGDYFYLKDESYRCLLLFLVDEGADLTYNRPGGTSRVLRLEVLVPWDADYKEGIPAGTYTVIQRNPDTSMDRNQIVPGVAIAGLPNVFEAWKMSGSWYYELENGTWTDRYARIDSGVISVTRGVGGSHTIEYDLCDCQKPARNIKGTTELKTMEIL